MGLLHAEPDYNRGQITMSGRYLALDRTSKAVVGNAFFSTANDEWVLEIRNRIDRFERFSDLKDEALKIPVQLVRDK